MKKDIFKEWGLDGKAGMNIGVAMIEHTEIERDFLNKLLKIEFMLPEKKPFEG